MSEELTKKQPILTLKYVIIYSLGIMGVQFGIGLVNSYQAEFFNNILGANLKYVAIIILAAKLISIIADFVIGNLIDRAKFKSGKMRPWILISAFPFAFFTMLTFVYVPFSSDAGRYIYILFIATMWNVCMSLADIPSQGMLALLSPDGEERNFCAGIANTTKSIALAAPGVFATVICMLTGSESLGKTEYIILAAVLAGIGLAMYLLIYFFNRENVVSTSSSAMSFKEMFNEIRNNKMLLIVFATYMLGFGRNISLSIAVQASTILFRDGIDLTFIGLGTFTGDSLSWLIGITCAVSSMVSIVIMPVVDKKWGEKKTFLVFGIYGFAVSLLGFLLYAFGGEAMRSLWAILIYQFLLGFAYGPNGYLPMVMTSDIVDYREWQTGKRTEGTQFAILSLSVKISNAFSVAFGIFMMGAIGFSSEAYYAYINAHGGTIGVESLITDEMQTGAWAIYFLIPGLCMLLSCIPMFWYKIDFKTKAQMRADLAARRAEAQSAVEAQEA